MRPPAPSDPAPRLDSRPDRPAARVAGDPAGYPPRTSPRDERCPDVESATRRAAWPVGR